MDLSAFEDRLDEDFQWPEIGDKLFSEGQHASAAWLRHHTNYRFYDMTEGYKLGADLLVEHADVGRWSKLVYPIVFCYRHFLELTLKTMLEKYGPMAN